MERSLGRLPTYLWIDYRRMWVNLKREIAGEFTPALSATLAAAQCAGEQLAYRFCVPQPD